MKHVPRFHVAASLSRALKVELDVPQMHHATVVLRLTEGDLLRVFNEKCGEWECRILDVKRRIVECVNLLREAKPEKGPIIACSLIKPDRFAMMLEKVTELGISKVIPLITSHTQYKIFNRRKTLETAKHAAEQSRRLSVPIVDNVTKIEDLLNNFNYNGKLLVGNERLNGNRLNDLLEEKCVFLVGPEGGFSDSEQDLLGKYDFVRNCRLGPNILRSETAAIVFASMWMGKFS
ncbi:MAG: 16S rRNA (uracil(1498)-N(3))-methyltransferase [Holosporaceae bacterium]|jgi:16S rRNA (uracil1498-N3)-methyltransferase|nr:16S rRNA (uracil(1498)-N(3))-methyltransferase [Holosporaceae bacterium]